MNDEQRKAMFAKKNGGSGVSSKGMSDNKKKMISSHIKKKKSSKYQDVMNKFSYLWNTDKFTVLKKPKYWKAVFVISTTPDSSWQKQTDNVLVAHGNTEDSAISELKKKVDERVEQEFSSLRAGDDTRDGRQFGFVPSDQDFDHGKNGVKFYLEYNNYDPHKRDVIVYDNSSRKLIDRITV
tara:strand:+ start:1791 stop:2333 length:543 start_codon:yes stop_codon:yes gene_type:complete